MPNSPITARSIRQLIIAYSSALAILLIVIVSGQLIIQISLSQLSHAQAVTAQVEGQELRIQRLLYDVVLLQSPDPHLDYPAITKAVEQDDATWEQIQDAMYSSNASIGLSPADFGAGATTTLSQARSGYETMRMTLHRILTAEHNHATPDQVRPDVGTFYVLEPTYLHALVSVYGDLVQQADSYTQDVRLLEAGLFVLTLLTLTGEILFVVRPAIRHLRAQLQHAADMLQLAEQLERAQQEEK